MVALLAAPAHGQNSADATTTQVMEAARQAIGPISPEQRRKACRAQTKQGEIIVCAPGDGKEWRIQSETELDPTSRRATRTGVPRAPKLDGEACDTKLITCMGFGRKRDPMIIIDLEAIPETPKGSDAEKVANGEMSDR
jgi:hypothetical protein